MSAIKCKVCGGIGDSIGPMLACGRCYDPLKAENARLAARVKRLEQDFREYTAPIHCLMCALKDQEIEQLRVDGERWRAYTSGKADPIAILNAKMLRASEIVLEAREQVEQRADRLATALREIIQDAPRQAMDKRSRCAWCMKWDEGHHPDCPVSIAAAALAQETEPSTHGPLGPNTKENP